jgi:hypothetical protein
MIRMISYLVPLLILIGQNAETPHKVLRFECSECHITSDWQEVKFDHDQTGFELKGQHENIKCDACHSLAEFKLTGSDCASCHPDVHQGKLSYSCDRCHTFQNWTMLDPLTAHAGTSFPLIGAHANLDCQSCHVSEIEGEYSFLKSECVFCHQADFERAANPSHAEMGFGTRCEECHILTDWEPANFSKHDAYFPIFSGRHAGVWSSCDICHADPQNYGMFTCFECHEHSQSRMDSRHRDVRGYSYVSEACYSCHPNGSGGD